MASSRKTIAVLSLTQCYGGGEKSIEVLVTEWAKHHRVVVIVEHPDHLAYCRKIQGEEIKVYAAAPGRTAGAVASNVGLFLKIHATWKPDVIVANSNKAAMVVALWKLLCPWKHTPIGIYIRSFGWTHVNFILRCLPKAVVLFPNECVLDHGAYAGTRLAGAKMAVVPNAVNFSPKPQLEPENWIGCVARITRWKGLHYLLDAMSQAVRECPDLRLKILGNVHEEDYFLELKAQVQRLGLQSCVEFLEFTSDPESFYQRARFLVISSVAEYDGPETFSRVIIEAWQHARPVVSFAVGGPKYLIDDETDGLLVPEKDVNALAKALARLWRDESLRVRQGQAGWRKVQEKFVAEKVAEAVVEAIVHAPIGRGETRPQTGPVLAGRAG